MSTPETAPLRSKVGTATTMIGWSLLRLTMPALTYGERVVTARWKYVRSERRPAILARPIACTDETLAVDPADPSVEETDPARVESAEVHVHAGNVALDDGRRFRDRAESRDLPLERRVDDRPDRHRTCPQVLEGAPFCVVVLPPRERERDAREQEDRDEGGRDQPAARRRRVALETLERARLAR